MHEFVNAADAGQQLADKLGSLAPGTIVVAASTDGIAVAKAINPNAELISDILLEYAGQSMLVVDLGVETGTRAWEVVQGLRAIGVAQVDLAVPVCSRQVLAKLKNAFDNVCVLVTPLAPRALRWHYQELG